jgi:hypothetical protein
MAKQKRKPSRKSRRNKPRIALQSTADWMTPLLDSLSARIDLSERRVVAAVAKIIAQHQQAAYEQLKRVECSLRSVEQAQHVVAGRLVKIEQTWPKWARDAHGNPLPVYIPPKPTQ